MNREPTFGDYLKAAFHFAVPVRGIGGIPANYMFVGLSVGVTIAYWPLVLFCSAIELMYLMALASHPGFQRIVRARLLQLGRKEAEEGLSEILGSLRDTTRYEYNQFCDMCDTSLRMCRNSLGSSGGGLLDSYEGHIHQFKVIMAKMLRMRDALRMNARPDGEAAINKRISEIEAHIANPDIPETTRESERNTLEILQKRLGIQSQIGERLSHINAEIGRLSEEVLLLRDQTLINSSSPTALADRAAIISEVVDQHSDWLRDQGQLLQEIETQ